MEQQWKLARDELYQRLVHDGKKGLSTEAISSSRWVVFVLRSRVQTYRLFNRQAFTDNGQAFTPKPYAFPSVTDAVGLVCAEIPPSFASVCRRIGGELIDLITKETPSAYVNEVDTMHMTLFHTSHPEELMRDARSRQQNDIIILRTLLHGIGPLHLTPFRVVLCSSGAIILLYHLLADDINDAYTIDRLRVESASVFSPYPTRQTSTILHTTLARIVDTSISSHLIEQVHTHCEMISNNLIDKYKSIEINNIWYVDEMYHYSARGPTTVIPLNRR